MKTMLLAAAALTVLLPFTLPAQDDRPDSVYAYATYFVCNPDAESRADEIIRSTFKPNYDAAVEQEMILSWSWLQHYVGGEWRRVLVLLAPDMDSLLDASGALGEIINERTPEAGRAFSAICLSHVDYIWQTVAGIGGGPVTSGRGDATFSVYLRCDMAREDEADELVRESLGPVYDRHVAEGELTSWNWLEHHVGGKYRRLLTFGAANHKALLRARAAILADFEDRRLRRASNEFNEICYEHEDYMWDVQLQKP